MIYRMNKKDRTEKGTYLMYMVNYKLCSHVTIGSTNCHVLAVLVNSEYRSGSRKKDHLSISIALSRTEPKLALTTTQIYR